MKEEAKEAKAEANAQAEANKEQAKDAKAKATAEAKVAHLLQETRDGLRQKWKTNVYAAEHQIYARLRHWIPQLWLIF